MRKIAFCAALYALSAAAQPAAKAPFSFDAMMRVLRIDDPQLSPDGKLVAFTVQTVDLSNDKKPSQIFVVPMDGGTPLQLTHDGNSNANPRWSPDSKRIFFISDRSNGSQAWFMNADGSGAVALTNIPTEVDGLFVSAKGKVIAVTSNVYSACSPAGAAPAIEYDSACNSSKLKQDSDAKMHARVYDSLLYRHWTEYQGSRRKHILVQAADGSGKLRDLTPGTVNTPPFALEGPSQIDISPDGSQLVYVANTDTDLASSTNSDLFSVTLDTGATKRLTTNPGADEGPLFSPDGKFIAYRTQTRGGYESDKWRLAILDVQAGTANILTESLDRWVESYTWSPDSRNIFFTVDERGTTPLLMMPANSTGSIRTIAQGPTTLGSIQFTPDNKAMIYLEQSGWQPNEIKKAVSSGGAGVALTHLNDALLSQYQLTAPETVSVDGADTAKIESFIVKPPDFNTSNKYPALILIHGGPEGDWGQSWSYRWNAQVFAGAGYVVVLPNPHGSIGYGQAFTDAVNGDWGGRAYDDLMATTDYVANLPYVDKDRIVAAGASYGGYMIDWILGHTDRFKALVTHAGVFDLRSEALTTEELWFPKWEFQGLPWETPGLYDKWSPSSYIKNFKTPTLVTHGELDYRVPIGQGQQLFTALQEMRIPSKLIQFPDEGHWILKPQNSQFWYSAVLDWLAQYTKPLSSSTTSGPAH